MPENDGSRDIANESVRGRNDTTTNADISSTELSTVSQGVASNPSSLSH